MEWLLTLIERPIVWLSNLPAPAKRGERREPPIGIATDLVSGEPVDLTAGDLARHAYLLGATGCGKTTAILALIERDLINHHSIVVLDLRGDLAAGALGLCARLQVDPERVTLLDLREKTRPRGFDPLSGTGETYVRALHLLDAVAAEAESWGVQLEETMRSAFLLLAHAREPLTRLGDLFHDRRFRAGLLDRCDEKDLRAFWARYDGLSSEKQQAWALPVTNKVSSLLAVPVLRAVLSGERDIDLGGLLGKKGSVLLVSLAVDELHRSARMLGGLLVSAISREMMSRVGVPEASRNPARLYVDEFENMASESFEGLIAEGRRFGLTLVLSHQTLSQLPSRLRSVVRNNVGVQAFFQLGHEDAEGIARELPEGVSASDLRALPPGRAFLMARDGTTRRVRFHPPEASTPERAKDYRERALGPALEPVREPAGFEPPREALKPDGHLLEDLL